MVLSLSLEPPWAASGPRGEQGGEEKADRAYTAWGFPGLSRACVPSVRQICGEGLDAGVGPLACRDPGALVPRPWLGTAQDVQAAGPSPSQAAGPSPSQAASSTGGRDWGFLRGRRVRAGSQVRWLQLPGFQPLSLPTPLSHAIRCLHATRHLGLVEL